MSIAANLILDSLTRGGLRLSTIELTFPLGLLETVIRNNDLVHTARLHQPKDVAMTPFAERKLLVTCGNWPTIVEQYLADENPLTVVLGEAVGEALHKSVPFRLEQGEWHLPYLDALDPDAAIQLAVEDRKWSGVSLDDTISAPTDIMLKASVARCARQEGLNLNQWWPTSRRVEQLKLDLELFAKLTHDKPTRKEYCEHQYAADYTDGNRWNNPNLQGAIEGWIQYKKVVRWEQWRDRSA